MFNGSLYINYVPGVIPNENVSEEFWCFSFNSNKLLVCMDGENVSIPVINKASVLNNMLKSKIYLGLYNGLPCYCSDLDDDTIAPEGMVFRDLRSMLGIIPVDFFMLIGRAFQLVYWDRLSRFCGRCGFKTEMKKDERAKACSNCGTIIYPRISPAVIVAITKEKQILLAHARTFRENMYSVIAGFVEPGETLEDCVRREVSEEVGIKIKNLKYFGSQPWPFPDALMIGYTAEYESGELKADGVEITDAGWYSYNDLPQIPSKESIAGQLISWWIENN